MSKPYRAKTISGAQAHVRRLVKQREETNKLLDRFCLERRLMAMLAAEGPCFDTPLKVYAAKKIRDEILRSECLLYPDGTPLSLETAK